MKYVVIRYKDGGEESMMSTDSLSEARQYVIRRIRNTSDILFILRNGNR